jgi:hypothetical protein
MFFDISNREYKNMILPRKATLYRKATVFWVTPLRKLNTSEVINTLPIMSIAKLEVERYWWIHVRHTFVNTTSIQCRSRVQCMKWRSYTFGEGRDFSYRLQCVLIFVLPIASCPVRVCIWARVHDVANKHYTCTLLLPAIRVLPSTMSPFHPNFMAEQHTATSNSCM